jgi:hypothetical protein
MITTCFFINYMSAIEICPCQPDVSAPFKFAKLGIDLALYTFGPYFSTILHFCETYGPRQLYLNPTACDCLKYFYAQVFHCFFY